MVGAGLPLQLPASTVTAAPILPVPLSVGAVTTAGLATAATTLSLKLTEADPPEFVAVTVTVAA